MKIKLIFIMILLVAYSAVSKDQDSLKTYRLGEIKVTDSRAKSKRIYESSSEDIPYHVLQSADMSSVSELQLYIPSGYIRTNSRGETMLFVRGAAERQLGLYFDGMSMNIPWDNRMDLSFVPADIIGNIRVDKSANSMLFGPNVLGGVVSISTLERRNPGYGLTLKAQAGDGGHQQYSLLHDGKIGNFNYIANISYLDVAGDMLSADAPEDMDNQRSNSSLRTNTDQKRMSAYIRGEQHLSESTVVGLSYSHTNQEKGVAAETYEGDNARFWRFPERSRNIVTLNAQHDFTEAFAIHTTFWFDNFSQKINSYKSFDFAEIDEVQDDTDNTLGGRIMLSYDINEMNRLILALNGFTTNHEEQIDDNPSTEFSQNTMSSAVEYLGTFSNLILNVGIGIDYNETPKTGVFSEAEGNSSSDFSGFFSAKYLLNDWLALTGSTSRRTRFATMREQYSGALGKFKTNPDLKPETGLLSELGVIFEADELEVKLVGFYNMYDNLIERIRLSKEEDPEFENPRRMRVNYSDATVSGVDFSIRYSPVRSSNILAFFTLLNTDAERNGKEIKHLNNRPEMLVGFVGNYRFSFGLKPQLELEYTGLQYQDDPEVKGGFVEIPEALVINARLSYDLLLQGFGFTEIFVRVNNIFDEYKLSQLGLPEAGRTAYAGIMIRV